jgi:fibronectin type 3 domain-containing protein
VASGGATGSVTISSTALNPTLTIPLSGTGVAVTHSAALSWTASTSVVSGYNVYRSSVSGGPYTKLNSSLDAGNTFTDSSVSSGQTYYYVVTAVDSNSMESIYSNQATAVIP